MDSKPLCINNRQCKQRNNYKKYFQNQFIELGRRDIDSDQTDFLKLGRLRPSSLFKKKDSIQYHLNQ